MLFLLIFSITAFANSYGFHILEGDVHLSVECLPKAAKEQLKKKDRRVHVYEQYEYDADQPAERIAPMVTRYVELESAKEIAKSCGLEGAQAFSAGELRPIDRQFEFQVVESESGSDCGYEVPRVQAKLSRATFGDTFLLGPGFTVLRGAALKAAHQSFRAAAALVQQAGGWGTPQGYFSRAGEPGVIYVVTDQTEMGTKMALYRGKGKKWKEVAFADYPPCGS